MCNISLPAHSLVKLDDDQVKIALAVAAGVQSSNSGQDAGGQGNRPEE